MKKLKVFMVCSGLGHINRGYESFFRDCFDALCGEPLIDITLFKGKGENRVREICLWTISRNSRAAKWLGILVGRGDYFIEQLIFFIGLVPHLLFKRPDLVYVSDINLGNFIRLLKKFMNCNYRIIFNNGGRVMPKFLFRWDHIQQVSSQSLKSALEAGVPPHKQTLLPHAVAISDPFIPFQGVAKDNLRRQLGLPQDKQIILSVGAISKISKRMDYVIQEVASLPRPRPFLLLIGEVRFDTQEIVDLGNRLLHRDGFCARTVAKDEVGNYYRSADLFTLASMVEGFGLVYVEALSYGLPCVVHDYETARFVLGEMGIYGDLSISGSLARLISSILLRRCDLEDAISRHAYAYNHFSWDKLKPKYLELFQRCDS